MLRRVISTVALVSCAGLYVFAATERANFILTTGERKSGTVVYHGGQNENLIDGHLNLGVDNGKDMTFPIDQVAVIDFIGGRPATTEIQQLGSGQMLALRNGTTQQGRFVNMIGGDTLVWESQVGQRQEYPIRDVSRVYLNPQSARTAYRYNGPTNTVGTAGQAVAGTPIRVDARQAWTDTGINVNAGDHVAFSASGQINYGQGAGMTATPDGGAERRANYPDPSVPVGALIGKVGNGAPFAIGMQTTPLPMNASGRLMLGVNDNELGDNSGFYTVTVAKQ
jgi:hypothetical protein